MSEESMAWLGCALWLAEHGATTAEAARWAGPVRDALRGAEEA